MPSMNLKDRALLHVMADYTLNRAMPKKDEFSHVDVALDGTIKPRPLKRQMQLILLLTDYWSRIRKNHILDADLWPTRTTFGSTVMSTQLDEFNQELAALGGGKREGDLFAGFVIESHGYILRLMDDALEMYRPTDGTETKVAGET